MKETDNTEKEGQTHKRRQRITVSIVVLIGIALIGGIAIAQTSEQVWEDDFEDGDADGWVSENPDFAVVGDSYEGSNSVYIETNDGDPIAMGANWASGPELDMTDDFEITGTFRHTREGTGTSPTSNTRLGILQDSSDPDANALLMFNSPEDVTFLSSDANVDARGENETVGTAFDDQWVRYRIWSDGGNSTLNAKVWEAGTTEPQNTQLTEDFEGISGPFTVQTGTNTDQMRNAWLDEITITGREAVDPNLDLDAPRLMQHGETFTYSVTLTEAAPGGSGNISTDVTDNASVTSMNTDGLTVDEENNLLIATDDSTFNERIDIRAEYNGSVVYREVTVASVSVENLDVLPGIWRFSAVINDATIRLILVSIGAGIAATRAASAFAGIGATQLVLTMGWLGGWVSHGIVLVGLFAALFIGFNLAANIDYSVRR